MKVTADDIRNWLASARAKQQSPKVLRWCGGSGVYLPPWLLRRCPHGCEPVSWRDACRVCGAETAPLFE